MQSRSRGAAKSAASAEGLLTARDNALAQAKARIAELEHQVKDMRASAGRSSSEPSTAAADSSSTQPGAARRLAGLTAERDALSDAFRKSCAYIEVLKQQLAHMEAARLVQFSEAEFAAIVRGDHS